MFVVLMPNRSLESNSHSNPSIIVGKNKESKYMDLFFSELIELIKLILQAGAELCQAQYLLWQVLV